MEQRREEVSVRGGAQLLAARDGPEREQGQQGQDSHQPEQGRGADVHQALQPHRQGQEGIRLHQRHPQQSQGETNKFWFTSDSLLNL